MNALDNTLTKEEFERWIKASHDLFEIFEGRYDAYPLSQKWVSEWFEDEKFIINGGDTQRLEHLVRGFDYEAFRNIKDRVEQDDTKWKDLICRIDIQFKSLIKNCLKHGELKNISFAIAPYLYTWNFQRFKEYYKRRPDFDLLIYFKKLGEFLEEIRNKIEYFKNKKLLIDQLEKESIKSYFQDINNKLKELGINNNEPVGTIKLLHIFASFYFPLIDNNIAKGIGLILPRGESLTSESYIKWMVLLKNWIQNYENITEKAENEFNLSMLKLVDEGLYLMSSIKLQLRLKKLGI